ncbi:Deoxyhypusine synthase [Mycoemilia scoparia]|uniref:deoxyhypusine synthase n=1 Tax=Mycoemilia scoparia TaxID=417184 RepID=A0A9W8DJK9_9FUNG|nr:Deoxyhypusine synthase [Mycoemilia scoparia]
MSSTEKQDQNSSEVPSIASNAVLVVSEEIPKDAKVVKGYDFNNGVDYNKLFDSYLTTGFQATSLGRAIEIVRAMRKWRLTDEPILETDKEEWKDPTERSKVKCKIFLGYTSNLISSGLRETLRYLVQHKMVDVVVATAGGVEEDFIKCMNNTYMGSFEDRGEELRKRGLNRIGNLIVPNNNYRDFEDWIIPIFDKMLEEQNSEGIKWTPSKLIKRLGKEINDERSVYYWAYKNDIPVYCPAITDGSLGDMLYFHSYKNPGLVLDLVEDIRAINNEAVFAPKTGMIILGGGIIKHHICNANLMRNGADFSVYINTAQEFDGSDAGARPDEAVSWGKIRVNSQSVKASCF